MTEEHLVQVSYCRLFFPVFESKNIAQQTDCCSDWNPFPVKVLEEALPQFLKGETKEIMVNLECDSAANVCLAGIDHRFLNDT